MTPVRPEELSALLDGELSADRAREVRTAISQRPALADEWERLAALDRAARLGARSAGFMPEIVLPDARPSRVPPIGVAALAGLLVLRLGAKLIGFAPLGWTIETVALGIMLAAVVRLAARDERAPPAGT